MLKAQGWSGVFGFLESTALGTLCRKQPCATTSRTSSSRSGASRSRSSSGAGVGVGVGGASAAAGVTENAMINGRRGNCNHDYRVIAVSAVDGR